MVERQAKSFAERLNRALDELEMPADLREREVLLAKWLGITREKARVMLNGYSLPTESIYSKIVSELGVEPSWFNLEDEDVIGDSTF